MHWELVFPIEQQVCVSNRTPDLLRTASSDTSTLLKVEIQMITLTSDKRPQKYRGKKKLLPVILLPTTARSWQHAVTNTTTVQPRLYREYEFMEYNQANLKGPPQTNIPGYPQNWDSQLWNIQQYYFVFVFISMYWRQVIDSFSLVCSYFPAAVCLNF